MEKQKNSTATAFHWIIIGCFLGYLAYSQNEFNGNSLLIGIAAIICILLGLFQTKWLHRKVIKSLGIIEIDLDESDDSNDTDTQ